MEIVKKIAVGILWVIATLMIVSVFIPSQINVERSIIIDVPKELVFQQVNTPNNWDNWFVWHLSNSQSIGRHRGPDQQIGDGKPIIDQSTAFELIEATLGREDLKPFKSIFTFEEIPEGTYVSWNMKTDVGKSPYRKYRALFLNKKVETDMGESLINLKKYIEQKL
jgi:hypothetical protein